MMTERPLVHELEASEAAVLATTTTYRYRDATRSTRGRPPRRRAADWVTRWRALCPNFVWPAPGRRQTRRTRTCRQWSLDFCFSLSLSPSLSVSRRQLGRSAGHMSACRARARETVAGVRCQPDPSPHWIMGRPFCSLGQRQRSAASNTAAAAAGLIPPKVIQKNRLSPGTHTVGAVADRSVKVRSPKSPCVAALYRSSSLLVAVVIFPLKPFSTSNNCGINWTIAISIESAGY